MRAPRFMPQERQAEQGAVSRCALGPPLVKAPGQPHPTLDLRRDVQNHADWHVEVDSTEVLIDPKKIVKVSVASLRVKYGDPCITVDYADAALDPGPQFGDGRRMAAAAVEPFWRV